MPNGLTHSQVWLPQGLKLLRGMWRPYKLRKVGSLTENQCRRFRGKMNKFLKREMLKLNVCVSLDSW
jgi:hypothetical protein